MNVKIPLVAILPIGLFVFLAIGVRGWDVSMHGCSREESRQFTQAPPSSVIEYVQDTTMLAAYRDEIRRTVGDSLRRVFTLHQAARRAARRMYTDSGKFTGDTQFVRDTVCLAGEDVRNDLIEDSSLVVSRDSARNVLAECEFDREVLLDSLHRREPSGFLRRAVDLGGGVLIGAGILAIWSFLNQ